MQTQYTLRYVQNGVVWDSMFDFTSLRKANEFIDSLFLDFAKVIPNKKVSATKLHDHAMKLSTVIMRDGVTRSVWIRRIDKSIDHWWHKNVSATTLAIVN